MSQRFLGFATVIAAMLCLWPVAQLDAFVAPSTGCHHNGTWYADRSLVPTMEKCLTCQCSKKTLVCRLKVCPEMPMPPPRGCIVVQQRSACCPYLSCARLDAFYKIPATRRIIAYLDHYERESIDRVVNDNMLQRRSDDSEVDLYVCVKNGTVYKSGSAMSSSNLCSYCYCIGGSEKCVKPKCMLPVEGCKPIFVDSTCCPVRYDCTSKTSGKSSQEVRYRKTSNKHFLRMSQRLQRNRGCTVGKQFYVEGQKMKSDADKPCDICFCIRGSRRCAPKKCSPALKNCIPVVPKGQCCPSSYDCGSQRDHNRSFSSRQFNLFSLLFGKEDDGNGTGTKGSNIPAEYPPDRHPSVTVTHKQSIKQQNDEKSIFDQIREGLEIIDGNNEELIAEKIDKLAEQTGQLTAAAKINKNAAIKANAIQADYPHDRHPSVTVMHKENIEEENDEHSLMDEIREGIAIVDGNTENVIAEKFDMSTKQIAQKFEASTASTLSADIATTDVSFLDLLLGSPEEELATQVIKEVVPNVNTPTAQKEISWIDLLLGPDDEDADRKSTGTATAERSEYTTDTTTQYQREEGTAANIDRIDDGQFYNVEGVPGNGEIFVGAAKEIVATTSQEEEQIDLKNTNDATLNATEYTSGLSSISTFPVNNTRPEKSTLQPAAYSSTTTTKTVKPSRSTTTPPSMQKTTKKVISKKRNRTTTARPTHAPTKEGVELFHKTTVLPLKEIKPVLEKKPQAPEKNGLLSAFLDGLSDILSAEPSFNETLATTENINNNLTTSFQQSTLNKTTTTPKPLPSFKPLPTTTSKPHTRINSKIANFTLAPVLISGNTNMAAANVSAFKPLPPQTIRMPLPLVTSTTTSTTTTTIAPTTSSTTEISISTTTTLRTPPNTTAGQKNTNTIIVGSSSTFPSTSTSAKPLVVKTNPTILEADTFDRNSDPTLPPSLPNLKIIPFLPTDAVKADRNKPLYDYYNSNSPTAKIDYEQYDEGNLYPAITERFPTYGELDDGSKAEYIYKFNVEGPPPPVPVISSPAGELFSKPVDAVPYVKYEFVNGEMPNKGFSPPTKTEGGFVPKEPLIIDGEDATVEVTVGSAPMVSFGESAYQVTKHIIDITTGTPFLENTTKLIEITTPDPFKDVIRTEPPPDLLSLIEDKVKILVPKLPQLLAATNSGNSASAQETQLIHITTAAPNRGEIELPSSKPLIKNNFKEASNSSVADTRQASIATFLDLLLGDGDVGTVIAGEGSTTLKIMNATSSTTVPPFKTLPAAAVEILQNTVKPSAETSTSTTTTTETTKQHISTKAPHINATRNKSKNKQGAHRNHTAITTTSSALLTVSKSAATSRPKISKIKTNSTRRHTTNKSSNTTPKPYSNSTAATKPTNKTTVPPAATTTSANPVKPFINSPFDTLPFMDASFEVKRHSATSSPPAPAATVYTELFHSKDTLHQSEGFNIATTPVSTSVTSAPVAQRDVAQMTSSPVTPTALEPSHNALNSLMDPTGILKLAGCNIYGRMYRVGRIILELSSPCLECKCTEVGVKCGQLAC